MSTKFPKGVRSGDRSWIASIGSGGLHPTPERSLIERGGGLGEVLGGRVQLVAADQGGDASQVAIGGLLVALADRFDLGLVFVAGRFGARDALKGEQGGSRR
jgi:hypothetical protein